MYFFDAAQTRVYIGQTMAKIELLRPNEVPPRGGFAFTQPETGWKSTKNLGLHDTATQVQKHRQANPRFKLATDLPTIEDELIQAAAKRNNFNPAYFALEGQSSPKWQGPPTVLGASAGVVGSAKRLVSGIRTLWDWVGEGGQPVPDEQARQRAATCLACPLNELADWKQVLKVSAAKKIQQQLEVKNDMALRVPDEDKIGICKACDCYMPLKVWTPMGFIRDYTSQDTKARYHEKCWVLKEW